MNFSDSEAGRAYWTIYGQKAIENARFAAVQQTQSLGRIWSPSLQTHIWCDFQNTQFNPATGYHTSILESGVAVSPKLLKELKLTDAVKLRGVPQLAQHKDAEVAKVDARPGLVAMKRCVVYRFNWFCHNSVLCAATILQFGSMQWRLSSVISTVISLLLRVDVAAFQPRY